MSRDFIIVSAVMALLATVRVTVLLITWYDERRRTKR